LMLQYNMSPETYMPDIRKYVTQEMVLSDKFYNDEKEYSVCFYDYPAIISSKVTEPGIESFKLFAQRDAG